MPKYYFWICQMNKGMYSKFWELEHTKWNSRYKLKRNKVFKIKLTCFTETWTTWQDRFSKNNWFCQKQRWFYGNTFLGQLRRNLSSTFICWWKWETYFSFITESYNENIVWLQILFQNLRFNGQQGKRLNFS